MKTLIAIGIVAMLAFLTNPNREHHVKAVKGIIVSHVLSTTVGNANWQSKVVKEGSILGTPLGTATIRDIADSFVSVDDYVVLSVTRLNNSDQSNVVGVGAFGNVWIGNDLGLPEY